MRDGKDPSAIVPIVFVRDMIYGGRFSRAKRFDQDALIACCAQGRRKRGSLWT